MARSPGRARGQPVSALAAGKGGPGPGQDPAALAQAAPARPSAVTVMAMAPLRRSRCHGPWPPDGLGGTSSAGLRSKNPNGLSQNDTVSTGITGQSSGRVM
jgi:hypothetical protein